MTRKNLLLLLVPLSLSSDVWARQGTPPSVMRGMASSLASGLSLPESTTDDLILVKPPLDQTTPPLPFNSSSYSQVPNYELSVMFPGFYDDLQIDAHSTGNDIIPRLSSRGVPNLANPQRWMAVTVSVTNETKGTSTSLMDRRRNMTTGRDTPGADLVSYYFEESVGIDASLVGATVIEQQAEDIRFAGDEDPDALDWGIGVISNAQAVESPLLFDIKDRYYFSLTKDCADLLNLTFATNPFVHDVTGPVPADGASVYVTYLVNGVWEPAEVYRSASTLHLDPAVDELDAVAVDPGTGVTVFSTQPKEDLSQLRAHDATFFPSKVFDLRNQALELVASNLGLADQPAASNDDVENIDAVCFIEPEPGDLDTLVGFPTASWVGETVPMGLSMTRWTSPQGVDEILFHATGWGGLPESAGVVGFMWSWDYDVAAPGNATWLGLSIEPRAAGQSSVPHPPIPVNGSSASTVAIVAFFYDGQNIKSSHVVQFDV